MRRRLNPEIKQKVLKMVRHLLACHNVHSDDQEYELNELYHSMMNLNEKYELFLDSIKTKYKIKQTTDDIERLTSYKDEYIG